MRALALVLISAALILPPEGGSHAVQNPAPLFVDASVRTGLTFTHVNGASGQYYMAEQMGAGAALFDYLGRTRHAAHAPRWLVRLLLSPGFIYGTVATIAVVAGVKWGRGEVSSSEQNAFVVVFFALVSAALAGATLRARKDVFPMALVIGSWIAITTAILVTQVTFRDVGSLFLVAAWLIGTSTAAGFLLMRWVREWRIDDDKDAPEVSA